MNNKKEINLNIELLRGYSVLIVFFFHYNSELFSSFFVGVDIFFFISGYVITRSILDKNKFDFFNYLTKRIKRIYPNLFFVLIIFFIFYFLFNDLTEDFNINFFSFISSLFGVSNFYYSLNPELFYFNQEIRWLMHTWSLSVEIQFYVFIGLVANVYFLFQSKYSLFKKIIIFIIITLTIFSFFIFIFTDIKFISDYYSFIGRLWEFIFGSILNFIPLKKNTNFNKKIIGFLIILSISNLFIINYKLIIISSLIIIFYLIYSSNLHKKNILNNFMLYYGKISYSFYLWHLIVLSFLKNYLDVNVILFFTSFCITTILSYFSYNLIELKFNKKFLIDYYIKKFISLIFFLSLIFIIYSLLVNKSMLKSVHNNFNKISIKLFKNIDKKNILDNKIIDQNKKILLQRYDECDADYEDFSWFVRTNCIKQSVNNNLVYLFGNSYSEHLLPAFFDIGEINIIHSRFENEFLIGNSSYNSKVLNKIITKFNSLSKKFDNIIIVVSLNRFNYSTKKLKNFLNNVGENNKVIIIYPHPSAKALKNKKILDEYEKIKREDFKKMKIFKNLIIFDAFNHLCNNCNYNDYSKFFVDESHYNLAGSLALRDPIKYLIQKNLE